MLGLEQNCYKKSNYKNLLWNKLSSECSREGWYYAFSERRLFILMLCITSFLFIIYISGVVYKSTRLSALLFDMDNLNTRKLYFSDSEKQFMTSPVEEVHN